MAKLYFYYAAMNAGKSTMLLQASYNYCERGMSTVLFCPQLDSRHQVGTIYSRIGLVAQAVTFTQETNLLHNTQYTQQQVSIACVLVDEAQFLNKQQVLQLTDIVDKLNIPVLAYGLRSDFRGEPFAGSLYLLMFADSLIEIKTVCYCGKKAIMNARLDEQGRLIRDGEQIQIGGNDRYIALCRQHFKILSSVPLALIKQHNPVNHEQSIKVTEAMIEEG